MTLHYTQASAGSGKTTSIERDVTTKLINGDIEPSQIMAVTFTNDAAAELKNRMSEALLVNGNPELAVGIMSARVGTVHAVFGQLLSDFAFELGLSPKQRVLDKDDEESLFYEALDQTIDLDEVVRINRLSQLLAIEDWRKDVLPMVRLMRSNGFNEEKIADFKQDSVKFLLNHLPKPDPTVSVEQLKVKLNDAITAAKQLVKPTKGLIKVIDDCSKLLNQSNLTWQNWIKISKFETTKMGETIFLEAMDMASNVLKNPEFQQDMISFIEAQFDVAQRVMHAFASLKKDRGLVDFTDQEALALEALNHPAIQERIRDEICYLIVDEFQDTSPIQMALFSKMSELVDDVLMVGDAKQAIYGFRGSDPKLALSVLDYIQQSDAGRVSSLPHSWRSREGLVALTNDLFTSPFSHLLTAEQVQLTPKCTYSLSTPELGWWTLKYSNSKSNEKILSALAEGIREHILSGVEVWDKQHNKSRPAVWRDVAVLFRKNDEAKVFATACAKIGLPLSLERAGLLETPEVSLALACLRVLVDSSDSLACAEVLMFVTGNSPEVWLKSRLESVADTKTREWNDESHVVLKKLVGLRADIQKMSVREALELSLMTADVTGIVTQWKETAKLAEHRLANLSKLVSLVDDYENHCLSQCFAATPAGFILWLKHLEQIGRDEQSPNPGDAITIETYHGAKGLEWPIVVCCSLDAELKTRIFGSRIVDTTQAFDWHNPLAGRILRYCPNPFSDHKKNTPLIEALKPSKDWNDLEQQARNEAIQLLYVGMTRARDQLILTTIKEPDSVGEQLTLLQNKSIPPLTGENILPAGGVVRVEYKSFIRPDEPQYVKNNRIRHWFAPASMSMEQELTHYLSPASSSKPIDGVVCKVVHDFKSRIALNNANNMEKIGNALHQCIALVINNPDIAPSIIEEILAKSMVQQISAEAIIMQSKCLLNWIHLKYPAARVHTEFPFLRYLKNGSLQQGSIDLVVETDDGWIVIDHKSNPQPKYEWEMIAAKHSGQLNDYREALISLSGKAVLAMMIHFSVSGGLVEVIFAN